MSEFKEKSKMGKPKTKPPSAMRPKQAARMMKEKYLQQLDHRSEEVDTETNYATDRIEGAGRWATDEAVSHVPRPRQRRKSNPKEQYFSEGESDPAEGRATQEPRQQPNRDAADTSEQRESPRQQTANAPKKRTTPTVKERTAQGAAPATHRPGQRPTPSPKAHTSAHPAPQTASPKAAAPRQAAPAAEGHRTASGQLHSCPPRWEGMNKSPELPAPSSTRGRATSGIGRTLRPQGRPLPGSGKAPRPQSNTKSAGAFRERTRTIFKTRSGPTVKPSAPAIKVKPPAVRAAKKAARQTAQRQMTQRMVAQVQRTARAAMTAAKKAAAAVVRAVAALVSSLVGLLGGGVLLVILLLVAIIAAVASSPFGIFFAGDGSSGGSSAPPTVSVAEAVAQINMEYNTKLEGLQAGDYTSIDVTGAAPEWPDVLATFASRYAAADDGVDVATLDADRVAKLTATFWDMCSVTSTVQSIHHPGTPQEDGTTTGGWTERILHITITAKTAEDMKGQYGLNDFQKDAMNELLADRAALAALAGSLDVTNADALAVLNALPTDLSPERRRAVETALQLVGKVNYFWGGKSSAIGWDSRWGQFTKVTAAGSSTTGTFRPYGLDCTGFIDWALRNAELPSDGHWYIGTNLTEVTQAEALPGDIALYDDASHVGMVVGRDSAGKLLICHCSSGRNNVVVTEFAASGFTVLGRPSIYTP